MVLSKLMLYLRLGLLVEQGLEKVHCFKHCLEQQRSVMVFPTTLKVAEIETVTPIMEGMSLVTSPLMVSTFKN